MHRGICEGVSESTITMAGEGSVTVEIGRGRPTLWEYLLDRLPDRRRRPARVCRESQAATMNGSRLSVVGGDSRLVRV